MKHLVTGLTKLTTASILVVTLAACGGADERKVKYLEKGKAYLTEKNYDKARIELKNVLQIDPKFAEAYYLMGQIEEANKELRKAIGNYKKALELDPNHTEAKIKLARIYVLAGTDELIKEAQALLAQIKNEQPDNVEGELVSITIKYKTGSKSQATKELVSIVDREPKLIEAVSLLATIYIVDDEDNKAIELLTRSTKDNPDNVSLMVTLAKLLTKQGKYDLAEQYMNSALELEPEAFPLQQTMSSFYTTTNQLEKAEAILRNSIKQDPEDAQRYLVLLEFLSARVSIKKAEEELNLAIKNNPDMYDLKFSQVKFYDKIGNRDEAKEILKQIISDKSYDLEGITARTELAKYLFDEGDHKSAKVYVDQVLAEYPNNNDALLVQSKLALADLDAVSAINGLRTVVNNDPKNAEAALLLAKSHVLNNDSGLAEDVLKKAIAANPANDQTHLNYANYLMSKGRVDEAVAVLDKALTYFKDSYPLLELKLRTVANSGDDSQIVSILDRMEQAESRKDSVNITRGQYYLSKNQIDKGIEQFELAYDKAASKYKPLDLIVQTYVKTNQVDKAKERLDKILSANNNEPVANQVKGQLHLLLKEIETARKHFNIAAENANGWFKPYSSLSATYLYEKDYDKAVSVLKDAQSKLKNGTPAKMQIASIYERQEKFADAISLYAEIIEDQPTNKLAANNYASLLLDYGQTSDIPKALSIAKDFELLRQPALLDTLGWAYAKSGDNIKAIDLLKPIVEKAPDVAVFRYHLGYALYQSGDKAAAKSHLEIATASEQNFAGKDNAIELLKNI